MDRRQPRAERLGRRRPASAAPGSAWSARPTPPPTNPSTGHALVTDIKTRGPAPYKQWAEEGAEISHPEAVVQLAAYQAMLEGQGIGDVNAPVLLICLDTGAREWDWERIPGDRARAALLAETERLMPLVDALEQVAIRRARATRHQPIQTTPTATVLRDELTPARDFLSWTPQCKTCAFAQACRPEPVAEEAEDHGVERALPVPVDMEVTVQLAHEATELYVESRGTGKGIGDNQKTAGLVLRQYLEERGVTGAVLGGHRVSLGTAKTVQRGQESACRVGRPGDSPASAAGARDHPAHRVDQAGAIVSHYPRETVVQAALDVVKPLLADHCEILTPAGSYRRGLAQCRDLDLVAVPKHVQQQGDMFGGGKTATRSTLTDQLAALRDSEWIQFHDPRGVDAGKLGDRMARFWLASPWIGEAIRQVPIDIYIVLPPATYAVILAIRTGSADWNRAMMAWLKSTSHPSWRIQDGALWKDGHPLFRQPRSEHHLYEYVGLPYVEPEHRGTMHDFQEICA